VTRSCAQQPCLGPEEIRRALADTLHGHPWVLSADERSIERSFRAKNWAAAMQFFTAVSEIAETAKHHPDLHLTQWRDVRVVLSTHAAGGLTKLDIDLAVAIDAVPVDYSPAWLRDQASSTTEDDEAPAAFDAAYYANGLNGDFLVDDTTALTETFAGTLSEGGGGKFEDPEQRDIARAKDEIVAAMQKHAGLREGSVIVDVGAGTGLLLPALAKAVGPTGRVLASELSPAFREVLELRKRDPRWGLLDGANVEILSGDGIDEKNPGLPEDVVAANTLDCALLTDVYHHLVFPRTVLRRLRDAMARDATLVVIDFHRDSKRVTSHEPDWVYAHVRADQATFTKEIESVGFVQIADVDVPGLPENYFLVFRKRPLPVAAAGVPGAGWAV